MNRILIALPLLAATTGCIEIPLALLAIDALDRPEDSTGYETYDTGYDGTDRETYDNGVNKDDAIYAEVDGQMRGSMPVVDAFDRAISRGEVWVFEHSIDLTLHATTNTWVMLGGTIDLNNLTEGQTVRLDPSEHQLYACSGESEGAWVFDGPPLEVEVTKDTMLIDGTEEMQLAIWADFGEGEFTTVVVVPLPPGNDN